MIGKGGIKMFLKRPEKYRVKLTLKEKRVLKQAMVDYRNLLIQQRKPTEDVDRILIRLCR